MEETLASKDRQVESLRVQLKELSGEKKALSQKVKHFDNFCKERLQLITNDSFSQLEKDRKLLNEENERVVRQLSERLKQVEEAKSQLVNFLFPFS